MSSTPESRAGYPAMADEERLRYGAEPSPSPDQTAAIVQQVTAAMRQPVDITDLMLRVIAASMDWGANRGGAGSARLEELFWEAVAAYQEGC